MTTPVGRGSWTSVGGTMPVDVNGRTYGYYAYASGRPLVGQKAATAPELDPDYLDYRAVWAGVKGIQNELNQQFGTKLAVDGVYGANTAAAVRSAQVVYKLTTGFTPGLIGPTFATRLFRNRVQAAQLKYDIPRNLLAGVLELESESFDPGAVGEVSSADKGLAQFHCDGSKTWWNASWGAAEVPVVASRAFDPMWAVEQAARRMGYYRRRYASTDTALQDDCSVAQHNAPGWADIWFRTGAPPTTTIASYVSAVRRRAAAY